MLGTVVGETIGYALTAAWTVMVAIALRERVLGRVLSAVGLVAAALIAVGTVEPLDVPMAGLLNFVGYVVWSVWLVAFAVRVLVLLVRPAPRRLTSPPLPFRPPSCCREASFGRFGPVQSGRIWPLGAGDGAWRACG